MGAGSRHVARFPDRFRSLSENRVMRVQTAAQPQPGMPVALLPWRSASPLSQLPDWMTRPRGPVRGGAFFDRRRADEMADLGQKRKGSHRADIVRFAAISRHPGEVSAVRFGQ
jgi:hypothetical protein